MFLLSRRWIDTRSPQLATWFYCSLNTQKILGRVEPASIWQLERLRAMVRVDSPLKLFTVVFNQCCWGAPYRKPTRLLANIQELATWGSCQWPQFDGHCNYVGPILQCQCQPAITLARTATADNSFRTSATSAYPEAMDQALAKAIFRHWSTAPLLMAKLGEGREEQPQQRPERPRQEQGSKRLQPDQEGREEKKARLVTQEKTARKPAMGPMQVSYKGETRALHDGAGLCSPGRWPVDRRRLPSTERETSTGMVREGLWSVVGGCWRRGGQAHILVHGGREGAQIALWTRG